MLNISKKKYNKKYNKAIVCPHDETHADAVYPTKRL